MKLISDFADDVLIPQVFGNGSFSAYSLSAFHDIRDPEPPKQTAFHGRQGDFNRFNRKLTDHARLNPLTDFVMENEWYRKFKDNIIAFDPENLVYAQLYVLTLREHGRWAHNLDRRLDVRLVKKQIHVLIQECPL